MTRLDTTTLATWRKLFNLFQREQTFRTALSGDGSSADTADVVNKPGWAWVRYDEKQDKASQVVNWRYPGIPQGVPIIVGKQYTTDRYYQVLGVNLDLYLDSITIDNLNSYILPRHGESHHGSEGSDPAPIDRRNLVFGKVQPTVPESMSIYAATFDYDANGVHTTWPGGEIDLTSYVPVAPGRHRYVLVSINVDTNALIATSGLDTPIPIAADLPSVPAGHIPLATVLLEDTDTAIYNSQIYDYRIVLGGVGTYLEVINNSVGALEAEIDFILTDHIMRIQANQRSVAIEESERDLLMARHLVEGV